MKQHFILLAVIFVIFASSALAYGEFKYDLASCRYQYQGYTYDLSSLVSK